MQTSSTKSALTHQNSQPANPSFPEPIFWGEDLPYEIALARQVTVHKLRVLGEIDDQFFYLSHPPVITYGRATHPHDLSRTPHTIPTIEVPRGGLATYHGPGQLIGYIIMDLKSRANNQPPDIHAYLRAIEDGLIAFLAAEYNLLATRRVGFTGVWTHGFNQKTGPQPSCSCLPPSSGGGIDHQSKHKGALASLPEVQDSLQLPGKLASIGVSARKWITSHGFALNLHPDMSAFQAIVPCGITDAAMSSVEQEHARAGIAYPRHPLNELAPRLHTHLVAALQHHGWLLEITND